MSIQDIHNYYNTINEYKRFGGTENERSIRRAFANLLDRYCVQKKLQLVDEVSLKYSRKRPDGTVRTALQQDWGYWESKDMQDNLDEEIKKKIEIGYPTFNILFENSEQIVLIQQDKELMRGEMKNPEFLHRILTAFIQYERPEITDFRIAVQKFKEDIPYIVETLRTMIAEQEKNSEFRIQREKFWNVCRESINPEISAFDIREMIIQHILTAEIFDTVFGDSHFHRENNIARELEIVVNTFFTGAVRRDTLATIDSYYKTIKREAGNIESYHEKQKFLKVVYENFYKAYNPKGADKLGVIYTPNEIVKFMVESTDFLLEKYFGKNLADKNVQILDPCTGTGTFITDIIEYIPEQYLKYKYKNEIHCNELAILPYYIANLNIEYTYQQKMKKYEPYENIVFVDTLDNLGFSYEGKQLKTKLYAVSAENLDRVIKQNEKKISVIIGNPPYNAHQQNENDNNKNRTYKEIDKRIKETYVYYSAAQKTKVYDMYARFYRWATDRINGNGIVAFITNRSFIDSRTFDGFRKSIAQEFDYAYIVDLHGDIRANSGQAKANVFNIMTGVAIAFFVRKEKADTKFIKYYPVDFPTAKEKLEFLETTSLRTIPFESIQADKNNNWINIADTDFEKLIPIIEKNNKNTLFRITTNGVATNRDEWVYDFDTKNLENKIKFFIDIYNKEVEKLKDKKTQHEINDVLDYSIKWSEALKNNLLRNEKLKFLKNSFSLIAYRPFVKKQYYSEKKLSDRLTNNHYLIFGKSLKIKNKIITINQSKKEFNVLGSDTLVDLHFNGDSVCIPLYRYDKKGNQLKNVTDWGLIQFKNHYNDKTITKEDIFYYTYAVFHNPEYVKKYELNLKREFPRVPLYNDFWKWSKWGKELMDLHIGYENVKSYELIVKSEGLKDNPNPKLKALPESGEIILDENTSISGIPKSAWEYKFGNRSALHWIVDQYKEKTIDDKTIAEKFNTYKFTDYKQTVIDLIKRITTVSVCTMEMVNTMGAEEHS